MASDTLDQVSLEQLHRYGDRLTLGILWFHLVVNLALASWYDTWTEALVIGLPAAIVPSVIGAMMPGHRLTRVVVAAAFMVFSALIIHQAHGMIEMHFGIFALLAFLLVYRDWLPIVVAAGVIAVHHLAFNYMQASGMPVYVFNSRTGLDLVLVHAAYVVAETAVLLFITLRAYREAVQSQELYDIGTRLLAGSGPINLAYRHPNASSPFVRDFNRFMEALHRSMRRSSEAANRLLRTTERLREVTGQTSRGVREEQQAIHAVATAIDQMTATTQEVARNALATAEATRQADSDARSGSQILEQATAAIGTLAQQVETAAEVIQRLDAESGRISTVLVVIKGVAEQTNLLALNAAIEAARAGEQGRGFAVVADEVRTLASRTQSSTHEIEEMIERLLSGTAEAVAAMQNSRDQAQSGVAQARQAGEALRSIQRAVAAINDMSSAIAAAAEQQRNSAEAVDSRIQSIREVADRNAGGAAEVAGSTDELGKLAVELREAVQAFGL